MKVGVIDYGVGNLGSVLRALETVGVAPQLLARPEDLREADRLVLPGVGNFRDCVRLLEAGAWPQALREQVLGSGKPLLGICVGMQLLASSSTEGADAEGALETPGLDFVPGRVENLRRLGCGLRVPHVGWNEVTSTPGERGLFVGIPDCTDFYFVHSYAFVPENPADLLATTHYGITIAAAVRRNQVWGTQFHPEKSSRAGFRLLRNFVEAPAC